MPLPRKCWSEGTCNLTESEAGDIVIYIVSSRLVKGIELNNGSKDKGEKEGDRERAGFFFYYYFVLHTDRERLKSSSEETWGDKGTRLKLVAPNPYSASWSPGHSVKQQLDLRTLDLSSSNRGSERGLKSSCGRRCAAQCVTEGG